MNLKKRLALGVFISTLLAFSAYYAEYLPFTGKWIAAYRMDRYAQEQYPGFHCGKAGEFCTGGELPVYSLRAGR